MMANPFLAMRRALKSRAEVYAPEEKQKLFNEYRDSLGLKAGTIVSSAAFTTLISERMVDYHGFKDTAGPGTLKIYEQLAADNDAAKVVRKAIEDALKPPPSPKSEAESKSEAEPNNEAKPKDKTKNVLETAATDYEQSFFDFNELIKGVPEKYKVEDVIGVLTDIHDKALRVIKHQQAHEIQVLEEQFNNAGFNDSFKQALGYSEADCDVFKKNMLADLKTAHGKQIATFEEMAKQSMNTLHQASAQQNNQFLFLANLHQNNDKMREKMRVSAGKKAEQAGVKEDVAAETNITKRKIKLSGIELSDLDVIENTTGKNIIRTSDGGYELQFGSYITNPLYYSSPKNNVEMDIRTLVEATKVSGAKGIVMNVNFADPELANTRAKQCYKACIESGYDPKDIKININGKLMKPEEIYTTEAHKLQALHNKSPQIIKQLEGFTADISRPKAKKIEEAKAEMMAIRAKRNELEKAEAVPASSSPLPGSAA